MKMNYFRINLAFLLCLGVFSTLFAKVQENSKKIHKEIEVIPTALVEIENAFGDLNISSWDENRVVIDVLITVKGRNPKSVQEKLDAIEILFSLDKEKVMAKTNIEENWGFKWFSGSAISYKIDYSIKLPRTSSVDLTNDYGTIRLNSLKGQATINCDYGKMILGDLYSPNNVLNFDYTSNSSIDFLQGGKINADYSSFDIEKAGDIELIADYTNASFDTVNTINFNNDYGKILIENIGTLEGNGDYLTLKCGTVNNLLSLENEFGLIQVKRINASVREVDINSEYTSIQLGIDENWSFSYEINLEYAGFRSSLPLDHSIENNRATGKYFNGIYNPQTNLSILKITSEFGGVKINPSN
jgi:hypothetical protein